MGREEIRAARLYIRSAEAAVNGLGICPRGASLYPFDIVALATLSKAFALSKACVRLLQADLHDEAYGLSRSVIECGLILRFLTAVPDLKDSRTRKFAAYSKFDQAYWLHNALIAFAGKPEEQQLREDAKKSGIIPRSSTSHWYGRQGFVWDVTTVDHPLDGTITVTEKRLAFAAEYHHTSDYVHCSVPAVDSYCPEEGEPFRILGASERLSQPAGNTLSIVLVHLHNSVSYALFGMGMQRPKKLDRAFQRARAKTEPEARK